MSDVQIHLALNHLPVAGLIFAVPMLIIALIAKSRDLRLISMALVIVSAAISIPVYFSGKDSEEPLEHLGASGRVIHEHEEMAEKSFIVIEIAGAIALLAFVMSWKFRKREQAATIVVLLVTIVAAGMIAWTAKLGGEIRHGPELGAAPDTGQQAFGDHDQD